MSTLHASFVTSDDPPEPKHASAKTMRFKLYWRHPGAKHHVNETYEKETDDPDRWCRDIIDWFNSTLRPHETKREFVRCEIEGEIPPKDHKWVKVTAMTKSMVGGLRHGAPYDAMQCERRGVTGKRFGLAPYVKLDSKFRNKVFARCDLTLAAAHTTDAEKEELT